jgi:hypothetical protein
MIDSWPHNCPLLTLLAIRTFQTDTVIVKGSSVITKLFTYDCAPFPSFLTMSSSDQDRFERDSQDIWNTDEDLLAMRRQITPDFERAFAKGRDLYLKGSWKEAKINLNVANELMKERWIVINDEENEDSVKGDGPCEALLHFMNNNEESEFKGHRVLVNK